jgi:hypothetical protein
VEANGMTMVGQAIALAIALLAIDCAGPVNEPETPQEFPDDTSGQVKR